jgi:pyruvate/2-oxoglutarate dehydrogenase complex dihydrolipoamide acyltransferase (E2) component
MGSDRGCTLRVSPARQFVADMLHFAQKVPLVPVQRTMDLRPVLDARRKAAPRPSWTAIFVKALGLTAQQFPELRRAWLDWPRPRLYEHPVTICAVAVERHWEGEPVVLAGLVRAPEQQGLGDIHAYLERLKEAPVPSIGYFRRALFTSRLPRPIRYFLWWSTLNWSGYKRAKRLGTCLVSSYGKYGVEQLRPLSPLTALLTFGPVDEQGKVHVRLVYDHRVTDGAQIARALRTMEELLNTVLTSELTSGLALEHHTASTRKG